MQKNSSRESSLPNESDERGEAIRAELKREMSATRSDGLVTLLTMQPDDLSERPYAEAHLICQATLVEMGLSPDAIFEPEGFLKMLERLQRRWELFGSYREENGRLTVAGRPKSTRARAWTPSELKLRIEAAVREAEDLTLQAKPFVDRLLDERGRRIAAGEDSEAVDADIHEKVWEYARRVRLERSR